MDEQIRVENVVIYEGMPFDDYLQLGGKSFSTIKSAGKIITPTLKMQLGSNVDAYLNPPSPFDGDLNIVKPIANALVNRVGKSLYNKFKKQVSMTANFIYQDMRFAWKGRLDWGLERVIIVDIKVAEDIDKTLFYFDYPNQIVGYCLGFGCKVGLILGVNPKKHTTKLINIPMQYGWWKLQILKYGEPVWNKQSHSNSAIINR